MLLHSHNHSCSQTRLTHLPLMLQACLIPLQYGSYSHTSNTPHTFTQLHAPHMLVHTFSHTYLHSYTHLALTHIALTLMLWYTPWEQVAGLRTLSMWMVSCQRRSTHCFDSHPAPPPDPPAKFAAKQPEERSHPCFPRSLGKTGIHQFSRKQTQRSPVTSPFCPVLHKQGTRSSLKLNGSMKTYKTS